MRAQVKQWYFGEFGGRFVPETLQSALTELDHAYRTLRRTRSFKNEMTNQTQQ